MTTGDMSMMRCPFSSMSDGWPNVLMSSGYNVWSNRLPIPLRSPEAKPFTAVRVSTYSRIFVPTYASRALTVLKTSVFVVSVVAMTRNERMLPTAGATCAFAGGAIPTERWARAMRPRVAMRRSAARSRASKASWRDSARLPGRAGEVPGENVEARSRLGAEDST